MWEGFERPGGLVINIMAQQLFDTIKFEEQLAILKSCELWMVEEIGIKIVDSRFEKIVNMLDIIVDHYQRDEVHELMQKYDEATLFYILTDAATYIKIYDFFKTKKSHEIPRKKIVESIKGPILPWEEEPDKGTAHNRNICFELETAVWIHKSDIEIENFDDVQFVFSGHQFNVECKRVHSMKKIADNIDKAAHQISEKMKNGTRMRGIICLCIDKLIDKEGKILQVNQVNDVGPHLDKLAIDFIKNYSHLWQKLLNINILGTAIVVNILASIEQDPYPLLTTCRHTVLDIIPNQNVGQDYDYFLIKSLGEKLGAARTIES
jgi:cell division protein ZapA (FtsZ GTPase activity inhibitor)